MKTASDSRSKGTLPPISVEQEIKRTHFIETDAVLLAEQKEQAELGCLRTFEQQYIRDRFEEFSVAS